jgi:hypothetical protein
VAPTADDERAALCARIDELTDRIRALDEAVSRERAALRGLRAQARSLELSADTRQVSRARLAELATREAGLSTTTTERSRLVEERAVHSDVLSRPADPGPPDAHLRYVSLPDAVDRAQHTAFLRAWAAISTPVLIGGIVVLLSRPTPITLSGFATFLVVFAGVEAVARRRLGLLLTVLAAAVWMVAGAGLVLALLSNWQVGLAGLLAVMAVALLLLNLRELVGPLRRARTAPPSGSAAPAAPPLSENTARPG